MALGRDVRRRERPQGVAQHWASTPVEHHCRSAPVWRTSTAHRRRAHTAPSLVRTVATRNRNRTQSHSEQLYTHGNTHEMSLQTTRLLSLRARSTSLSPVLASDAVVPPPSDTRCQAGACTSGPARHSCAVPQLAHITAACSPRLLHHRRRCEHCRSRTAWHDDALPSPASQASPRGAVRKHACWAAQLC